MKRQNVRTITLIVCTFTYLLIGAAIFDSLESETEKRQKEALQDLEHVLFARYNISRNDFRVLEMVVLKSVPQKAGSSQWKFSGAFYYALSVLTTIGYGHSTCTTIGGKLFTMCYAAIGIPLGLVMFQSIGERLNRFSSFAIRNVKKLAGSSSTDATETNLICVVTTLSTLTIAGGAAAFSHYEGWTYFDSVYYCFITLTTIGFGDMVALTKDRALDTKPEYVAFSLIFILFGLAVVAACLNLLVMRFITMNTEDERRDEAEALQAAAGAVRLEGDVITQDFINANGSIGHIPQEPPSDRYDTASMNSVCSCSCRCPKCPFRLPFCRGQRPPRRLTLTKSPAKVTHIQPFDRNKSVAVYHRHPYQNPPTSSSGAVPSTSSRHHSRPLPSESFELSPSRSPSPILELYDSPFKDSCKRMSV